MQKVIVIAVVAACMLALVFIIGAVTARADGLVVEITDLRAGEVKVEGFELVDKTDIEIYIVGAGVRYVRAYFAYGWIIDAESRRVVWSMQEDCYDVTRQGEVLYECEETISLEPGRYEAYYSVGVPGIYINKGMDISINDLGDLVELVGDIFKFDEDDRERFYDEDLEELSMTIKANTGARSYVPVFEEPENTIVSINQPERDEYQHQGFSLTRETDLNIYAIGEYSDLHELFVDGGWIIDARTRKSVWTMDKWNTDRAGGADKNRMFKDEITLPAGDYIAYYVTDDSHDPGEWNSPPPADPMHYGLLITTADPDDFKAVGDYDESLQETEIVSITKVRNNAFLRGYFMLKQDADLHVYALGERSYSDDALADYGWIADADNMDKVWEMTYDNTGFAGGASKNCVFDGIVSLPAGNYIVYYRTDDSHAYGHWNAAEPFDRTAWGITVSGVGPNFTAATFEVVDGFKPSGDILANMTGVGDDEDLSESFSLSETTQIKISAMGEGKSGRMYDYGWIENDKTGEIVWEMTYRKTRHAGGAAKNREVVANLTLEPGEYTAYFVTDGSHSFEDFNASPPDYPERWGMIVTQR